MLCNLQMWRANLPSCFARFGFCAYLVGLLFIESVDGDDRRGQRDSRPNIVFLLADDQCTYSMGCYGTPNVQTPHLDRLARDGVVFDKHYDTTAICMASRVNIMTGKYEYKSGCNFEHGPLLEDHWLESYPMLLREAGYKTAFAGKFGFEVSKQPSGKSWLPENDFDRWGGGPGQTNYQTLRNPSMKKYAKEYPHSTLSYGAFGRDFILDTSKQSQPFCLSISFKAPHHPTTPDPQFDPVYRGKTFVKPLNFGREYGEHFSAQSRLGRQFERFHSWNYSDDYDRVMATYYQQIYAIDVAVGMIREAINDAGIERETVVIYTSDNGFLCGSHGYASKVLPYEESSRVPLIIYDPRNTQAQRKASAIATALDDEQVLNTDELQAEASDNKSFAGDSVVQDLSSYRRCSALTGNVDLAPTILSIAGVPLPISMDGKDLMHLYEDPQQSHHEWLPLINVWGPSDVHSLAVVAGDWKYIRWPATVDGLEPSEELYQLTVDPMEITNLINLQDVAVDRDRLRSIYDKVVEHWQTEGVSYHRYPDSVARFKRSK
jgi:arylsulfatase A-like enzyme